MIDLDSAEDAPGEESCEVCIIGAGAAGAFLARRLWEAGVDVVVLEAGGDRGQGAAEADFAAHFTDAYYPGAVEGRAFGLGGTTSLWGGALVPHTRHDLRGGTHARTWQHIVDAVDNHGPAILRLLGFELAPEFESFAESHLTGHHSQLDSMGFAVQASLMMPFRKKNLFSLVEGASLASPPPRIYTRAVAKGWQLRADGHADGLTATSSGGKTLTVVAKRFVVAAGAIECARILLELKAVAPAGVSLSNAIGDCLGDHLSAPIADVDPGDLPGVTQQFAPRFAGPWMRTFRFLETAPPPGAPRSFTHFIFDNQNAGFMLAKNVLTSLQARRVPRVSPGEALSGIGGVLGLAKGRFIQSRLHLSSDTPTRLQLDIEQTASPANCIRLGDTLDQAGRRTAVIRWRIGDEDVANLRSTAERVLSAWEAGPGELPKLSRRSLDFEADKPHDAYHPVGVCRMGDDEAAVVDLALAVRGLRNVSVVSTAVLPSAGTANPTFTMLCLAQEWVDSLDRS